jgi:hypothetical protein
MDFMEKTHLRMLDFQNEIFMADVHKDQRIYLEDPQPVVPQRKSKRGKAPSRLKAQTQAIRVDEFVQHQSSNAWQKVKIRDSCPKVLFQQRFCINKFGFGMEKKRKHIIGI